MTAIDTAHHSIDALEALRANLSVVRERVAAAARRAGRNPDEVTVVGVTKTFGRDVVDLGYEAGLRHFGENRVQEAQGKIATPLPPDATLHLIGHLQTNKARPAARLFDLVESVDRPSLVEALDRATEAASRDLPVLIQVNVAGETQKAGCAIKETATLLRLVQTSQRLRPLGLMTIAPLVADPEDARPVFRELRRLRDGLCHEQPGLDLPHLSMGMSNDFGVAIEEGATFVRIGRALFGERP
jgi:PLP dependent protein